MAKNSLGFDFDKFTDEQAESVIINSTSSTDSGKKRGRPKKSSTDPNVLPAAQSKAIIPKTSMSYVQENIPYAVAYQDTNKQLDDVITQLDFLGGEIVQELVNVKSSKTLKNKYNYINDMTATACGIVNAKLNAIKEKNKTINDINTLELKRIKDLTKSASEEDDNVRIANLYDAFINTPVGIGISGLAPSPQDIMMAGGNINSATMDMPLNDQAIWEQNLTPAENRMVLQAKGAIETAVVYDEASGNRWFDVIDKSTGQSVPNVEKPNNERVYDLDINVRGGYAKDSSLNITYPLIVINGPQ